jgi:hypothetical protein
VVLLREKCTTARPDPSPSFSISYITYQRPLRPPLTREEAEARLVSFIGWKRA